MSRPAPAIKGKSTSKPRGSIPRELTVQEVANSPLHKDTEFAKRVLDDECFWWLTYAILFENCLKIEGYEITPRSDFSRRNMAIGAWIAEHEDDFVLTSDGAAYAAHPLPVLDPDNLGAFYDLLENK
jgi:hypothetical protein